MKQQFFRPLECAPADGVTVGHSVTLIHTAHMKSQFEALWLFLTHCRNYLPLGHCEYSTCICLLSCHGIAVKSALVLTRMSPLFSFVVFGLWSCGMPHLFGLTVPQQSIRLFAKSSNNSGEGKKLSMYNLWPCPSIFLVISVTVAWVAVTCCAVCPFPGILS